MYDPFYSQNKAAMKRCSSTYNFVSFFYLGLSIPYILINAFLLFLAPSVDGSERFFNIILKLLFMIFGYLGCYKKRNLYAFLAPAVMVINVVIFFGIGLNAIILAFSVGMAVLTCAANKKYHELEQCEGFPEFNERFQKQDNVRNENKDVYKEQLEYYRSKHDSNEMDEL